MMTVQNGHIVTWEVDWRFLIWKKIICIQVLRIKATGKVAWAVAIGAIGVAVIAALATPATGGVSNVADTFVAPVSIGILGGPATLAAVSISIAAGGVGALNKLRKYKIVEKTDNRIVLRK